MNHGILYRAAGILTAASVIASAMTGCGTAANGAGGRKSGTPRLNIETVGASGSTVAVASQGTDGSTGESEDVSDTAGSEGYEFPEGSAGMDRSTLDTVDDLIGSQIKYGFSGAQLAVIKDGQLAVDKAYGSINGYHQDGSRIEQGDADYMPVTTDTLFDLASNTKMYSVNYALQYLATQGKVDLDEKIVDIIGQGFADDTVDIVYSDHADPGLETNKKWKESLTIRDILKHEGGFPADPHYDNDHFDQSIQKLTDTAGVNVLYSGSDGSTETRKKTLEAICRTPLMYQPGTKTLYSDVDYMLLDFVIEKITGERLDEYCSSVFWKPMGLKHICYRPLESGFTKDDCAATELNGNTRDGRVSFEGIRTATIQGEAHDEKCYYAMAGISGHAGMFANAGDLARLAYVMLDGSYNGRQYFSKDVIREFTEASGSDDTWGLGWWRQGTKGRYRYFSEYAPADTFGHEGWTGTLTLIDPDNRLVIVLLTNRKNSPVMPAEDTSNEFYCDDMLLGQMGTVTEYIYASFMLTPDEVDDKLAQLTADQIDKASRHSGRYNEAPYMNNAAACEDLLITRAEKRGNSASAENAKKYYKKLCDMTASKLKDKTISEDITRAEDSFSERLGDL